MMKLSAMGLTALLLAITWTGTAFAEAIRVGGYVFPPFVEKTDNGYIGITIDLIKELNTLDTGDTFKFVPTSPKRRYMDLREGSYDIIMFEDRNWGWDAADVDASKVFLEGGEVYITKADGSKNQTYFDCFKGKAIAAILGYHYGFASFNANEHYLKKHFNIQFSSTPLGNIEKVLQGRADISVVSISYLKKFLRHAPDAHTQLLISKKMDQKYRHSILVRKGGPINVSAVNALLDKLQNQGIMKRVLETYGIQATTPSPLSCEPALGQH